ncbi:hypothetical protein [Nocardia jiangsuensis]|uniref:Uncharacterized protein n=1 Tax=Nocardia jiangsuensis TaxID=1691563 RepID=A0ABV8DP31_9NOCA
MKPALFTVAICWRGGVSDSDRDAAKPLSLNSLHPYLSVVVLECTGHDVVSQFAILETFVSTMPRRRAGRTVETVAAIRWGSDVPDADVPRDILIGDDFSELAGFVRRVESSPSWASEELGLRDIEHLLVLMLRQERLVAIYADDATTQRLQRWLSKAPRPQWRRLPATVLEAALLSGEVKGLWLQGTHRRRSSKPDSKNIVGLDLRDALDPAHDSSFALRAARADLKDSPERTAFKGKVGTTPANSAVWSSERTASFRQYVRAVSELLTLIRKVMAEGSTVVTSLPILARETLDTSAVRDAYAVTVFTPEGIASLAQADIARTAEADLIQHAIHDVVGDPSSPAFQLEVGIDGSIGGTLGVTPVEIDGRFRLDIGIRGAPSDISRVTPVRDALSSGDSVTVYYRSGHAFVNNTFYTAPITTARFSNWSFEDFGGYRIDREKPDVRGDQAIHDSIGLDGDTSLFAWVLNHYGDGWLICDDGSGEVADFLHIADDGVLTFIHVKATDNVSPLRRIAVVPYEVVVSQAVKNSVYADADLLAKRLQVPRIARPAAWTEGKRVPDRSEFLEVLAARDATDRTEVVVIQPHVSEQSYWRVRRSNSSSPSNELLRLYLLERLLTSARSNVVASCDEFTVVGSAV